MMIWYYMQLLTAALPASTGPRNRAELDKINADYQQMIAPHILKAVKPNGQTPATTREKVMPRPKKAVTHEQITRRVTILGIIKGQPSKEPLAKKDIAESIGLKTVEIADDAKAIEAKGWVTRRTGPVPKSIYYKISAKGTSALKAYDLLYG